jgi:hypothetical protein
MIQPVAQRYTTEVYGVTASSASTDTVYGMEDMWVRFPAKAEIFFPRHNVHILFRLGWKDRSVNQITQLRLMPRLTMCGA